LNLLLVYLLPVAVLLIAAGALEERRVARTATVALIAFALALIFYGVIGFGIQFGGIGLVNHAPGFKAYIREWSPLDVIVGPGWGVIGLDAFGAVLNPANADVMNLYLFHAALAGTAILLPVLAVAVRVRSRVILLGAVVLALLIYPLAGNWVWSGGWLAQIGLTSGLGHGVVDLAGSGVVFTFGGFAALGALLGAGARTHTRVTTAANIPELPSAHLPLLMILGAFLFLVGIGLVALGNPLAPKTLPTTLILFNLVNAAVAGTLVATLYGWFVSGEPSAMLASRGAVAGMVAIAASLPFVPAWSALLIGGIAGLLLPLTTYVVERGLRIDDRALVVPTFGVAGIWGLLALAIFADGQNGIGWNNTGATTYLGVPNQGVTGIFALAQFVPDSPGQMEAQFFGVVAIGLLAFLTSWLVFFALSKIGGAAEE
jgi:ammonium transporter, Amt family